MRVVFFGTGDIGVPTLSWLIESGEHEVATVVTQPDKPVGRKQEVTPSPVKKVALQRGVPVLQPARMRRAEAVEEVAAAGAEVIVVMAYGQILPRGVLEAPTVACINLHASLLPRHRGAAPIQAAVEAGDAESGITVMYVDEGLDTGDILLERSLKLGRRETGGTLHDRIAALGPPALKEALRLLQEGRAPRIPQDPAQATYAAKLSREDGLIDWRAGSGGVDRRVRAMNPWPGAFTMVPGPRGPQKLKIFTVIRRRRMQGPPGEVLAGGLEGITVGAGGDSVLVREVQLEGKRRMPAHEFLRGNPIPVGTTLGIS